MTFLEFAGILLLGSIWLTILSAFGIFVFMLLAAIGGREGLLSLGFTVVNIVLGVILYKFGEYILSCFK